MKAQFMAHAKRTGMTVAEIGVITGSIIITKKFIDARTLFAKQIEADPTYADKWYIKHQGAIKLVGGALAASYIKNPWLKMVCIGIAIEGAITEARVLTTNKSTGLSFFEQIGAPTEQELDQEMLEAAKRMNGANDTEDLMTERQSAVAGFQDNYGTMVAGYGNKYGSMVAGMD